jgi:hypothetical protein
MKIVSIDAAKVISKCNAKIPRDVIQTRDGGQGRKLDYLPGFYVIDLLNEVFGQGQWAMSSQVELLHAAVYPDRYGKDTHYVHYRALVRLVVKFGPEPTEFSDYGYGDGSDKVNPGKAHELAMKEAVTDGLKRCARYLGNAFGNGLYDRSGDGIDEGSPTPKAPPVAPKEPKSTTPEPREPGVSARGTAVEGGGVTVVSTPDRAIVNKTISQVSRVGLDKGSFKMEDLTGMLGGYGVTKKEELTDAQAVELLNRLKEAVNK